MDRFNQMTAFIEVVNCCGFTAAAKKMGVSKSAVSKDVSALEARLGLRLLERTTRRVSVTLKGEVYFEGAVKILEAVRALDESAMSLSQSARLIAAE